MSKNLTDLKYEDAQYDALRQCEKSITFDGGTTNAIGDFDGTGDPFDIFTVTGTVRGRVYAVCTTTLTIVATATLEVGTAKNTAGVIAQTAGDAIDVDEIWHDASPDASVEALTTVAEKIINQDVIGTTATANITAGVIKFICVWTPVSSDGNVVAA